MKSLLIDIGNSRIKLFSGTEKSGVKHLCSSKYNKSKFESEFRKIINRLKGDFKTACISSTDKRYSLIIKKVLQNFNTDIKFIIVNSKTVIPLKLDYASTLGSDRISTAVGAFIKYSLKKNILVIDFGTATTFNLIIKGTFEGGMISPGVVTMLKSLATDTTLPRVTLPQHAKPVNKNTKDSIKAGAFLQNLYTVIMYIKEMKKKYTDLYVIATGGLAEVFAKETGLINRVDKFLTAEGLHYIVNAR